MSNIQIVQSSPRMKRDMRKPQIAFNVLQRPYQIQPFFIHPVLPGESLKNAVLSYRTVSDPLVEKLMGWWSEMYVFYVKHTDLDIGQDLIDMHMDPTKDMSSLHSAADAKTFHPGGGINFTRLCMEKIVEWYFRDEDEAEPSALDGLPPAKINHDGWWESAKLESANPLRDDLLAGQDPTIPYNAPDGLETEFEQYQRMVAIGATDATFEDYLRTFGVRVRKDEAIDEQKTKPELIRFGRHWTYPTNTVEPTTGIPSSAAVWSESIRLDKDRYFREPGFLIGLHVVRPKVQYRNVVGTVTSFMTHYSDWLPALLQDEAPFSSLKEFATGAGPAPQAYGEDYWIDVRDLFLYGEQFRNHAGVQGNGVALPDATLNFDYASQAMVDAMFVSETNKFFRTDGIASFDIAGKARKDMT